MKCILYINCFRTLGVNKTKRKMDFVKNGQRVCRKIYYFFSYLQKIENFKDFVSLTIKVPPKQDLIQKTGYILV